MVEDEAQPDRLETMPGRSTALEAEEYLGTVACLLVVVIGCFHADAPCRSCHVAIYNSRSSGWGGSSFINGWKQLDSGLPTWIHL